MTMSDVNVMPSIKGKGKGKELEMSWAALRAAAEQEEIETEEIRQLCTRATYLVEMADQLEAMRRSRR